MKLKVNDRVKFLGASREQIAWGNCDDPNFLSKEQIYTIENVDAHTWHTKIRLKGIDGRFNSVCFEFVSND